jgi:hypothetical protein
VSDIAGPSTQIRLRWPSAPEYRPVGRLVLGGVGARTELGYDRVGELELALDALTRHQPVADHLELTIDVDDGTLRATVGPFAHDPLSDVAAARVIRALVDSVESVGSDGDHRVALVMGAPGVR